MNNKEIQMLKKMKQLISNGKCKFKKRHDRDYLEDLINLGITIDDAWDIILRLKPQTFFYDEYYNITSLDNALTFHWLVNGKVAYIKLKIEYENGEETVCWSFHEDGK